MLTGTSNCQLTIREPLIQAALKLIAHTGTTRMLEIMIQFCARMTSHFGTGTIATSAPFSINILLSKLNLSNCEGILININLEIVLQVCNLRKIW